MTAWDLHLKCVFTQVFAQWAPFSNPTKHCKTLLSRLFHLIHLIILKWHMHIENVEKFHHAPP